MQTHLLHERSVIWRIVRHHDHGVGIEPLDQHAGLVVGGWIHRTAQKLGAALENPLASPSEQRLSDDGVVDALEEPEKTGILLVKTIMRLIEDGRHSSHDFAISLSQ